MIYARVAILFTLTGLQAYFCYVNKAWVSIPNEMWIVGLLCGGEPAMDMLSRINLRGSNGDNSPKV